MDSAILHMLEGCLQGSAVLAAPGGRARLSGACRAWYPAVAALGSVPPGSEAMTLGPAEWLPDVGRHQSKTPWFRSRTLLLRQPSYMHMHHCT